MFAEFLWIMTSWSPSPSKSLVRMRAGIYVLTPRAFRRIGIEYPLPFGVVKGGRSTKLFAGDPDTFPVRADQTQIIQIIEYHKVQVFGISDMAKGETKDSRLLGERHFGSLSKVVFFQSIL